MRPPDNERRRVILAELVVDTFRHEGAVESSEWIVAVPLQG